MIRKIHVERLLVAAALWALAWNAPAAAKSAAPKEKVTYLGVIVTHVDDTVRAQLKLTAGAGVAIQQVMRDSPAEKAGLKPHDILEKLDDQLLFNAEQLTALVRSHQAGDKVTLEVIRQGKPEGIEVALGEQERPKPTPLGEGGFLVPGNPPLFFGPEGRQFQFRPFEFKPYQPGIPRQFYSPPGQPRAKQAGGFLGVELRPVDASLAAQLGLKEDTGALVGHVVEGSPAQKADLHEYDIILKVDGESVKGPNDLSERIQAMKKGQSIRLEIMRQGKTKEIEATLGAAKTAEVDRVQPLLRQLELLRPGQTKDQSLRQFRYVPRIEVNPFPRSPGEFVIRFEGIGEEGKAAIRTAPEQEDLGTHQDGSSSDRQVSSAPTVSNKKRAVIVAKSDQGSITIREDDGTRLVTVKTPEGKVLFEGPVTNEVQRAKLPPEIRRRLDKISTEISLPTGQQIQEIRVWNPLSPPI